jgi:hypothetical protein
MLPGGCPEICSNPLSSLILSGSPLAVASLPAVTMKFSYAQAGLLLAAASAAAKEMAKDEVRGRGKAYRVSFVTS